MKPSQKTVSTYNKTSAATKYGLGFEYKGFIYLALTNRLLRKYLYVDRESTSHGGKKIIRFGISLKQASRLVKTAICVGTVADMDGVKNKGERFEQLVYKLFGQQWHKDHTPYWKAGDITVNGEQIQLKYQKATVTTYKVLARQAKAVQG